MSKTKTIAIGLGLATGALLATWLLTGNRKDKTKKFIARSATGLKDTLSAEKAKKSVNEDSHSYYI